MADSDYFITNNLEIGAWLLTVGFPLASRRRTLRGYTEFLFEMKDGDVQRSVDAFYKGTQCPGLRLLEKLRELRELTHWADKGQE